MHLNSAFEIMRKINNKDKNYTIIKWNIYEPVKQFDCVADIQIETIMYGDNTETSDGIEVIFKMPNIEDRILKLPKLINRFYPVILIDNPKTVIHGSFNSNGNCEFIIATKVESNSSVPKSILWGVFGLHLKPLSQKINRLSYKPTSIAKTIISDIKGIDYSIGIYKRNKQFLEALSVKDSAKITKTLNYYIALFIIFGLLFATFVGEKTLNQFLIKCIPFLFVAYLFLAQRYQIKYRKCLFPFQYLIKFITFRGF